VTAGSVPRFGSDGLVPAVVQDAASLRVLMVGYMNAEAFEATSSTGQVHFWSRSRQELWRKGETSGNVLDVEEVRLDCDDDTVLVLARPAGPVCHTGSYTCFDDGGPSQGFARLESLWETIEDRISRRPEGSYTARLADEGPDLAARKLVEEATEVLIAAKDHHQGDADDRRLAEELADTLYHLLVVAAERGVDASAVLDILAERAR
jgi:phosphoribosyl-ATP pyrophosphohydrolase/phosphoribosyl-AMP cyclohydrolase